MICRMYRVSVTNSNSERIMYFQAYGNTHGFTFAAEQTTLFDNVDDVTDAFDTAVRGLCGNPIYFVRIEFLKITNNWDIIWHEMSKPLIELERM